jgi:hypothetical protein
MARLRGHKKETASKETTSQPKKGKYKISSQAKPYKQETENIIIKERKKEMFMRVSLEQDGMGGGK